MSLNFTEPVCSGSDPKPEHTSKRWIIRVRFNIFLMLTSLSMFSAFTINGQDLDKTMVTIEMKNEPLSKLLDKLREVTHFSIVYSNAEVDGYTVTFPAADRSVKETLDLALKNKPLAYKLVGKGIMIYAVEKKGKKDEQTNASSADNRNDMVSVTGKVTDVKGVPMPGVNILVKGAAHGTTTGADGEFVIDVSSSDYLVFSFIGYKTVEVAVSGRTVVEVILEEDVTDLKEVVVNAGYYSVKDREKTGSISKVTADVIEKQPVTNPLGALQGRMPGVYIQQTTGVPGGDFKIQIRGRNSLRDDGNEPLYIVDGVPFSMEKTFSAFATGEFGQTLGTSSYGISQVSPLTSLNPRDIESIEILKDADATAIYGSRGANGVVLITTKKGRAGKTEFDFNVSTGFGNAPHVELLNTRQYLSLRKEAFSNDSIIPSDNPSDMGYAPELTLWDTTRYTDWQDALIGNKAELLNVQSSISGGSDNTQFIFSLGFHKENAVYPGNFGYQKASFHLATSHRSNNGRFLINFVINGLKDKNNQLVQNFTSKSRYLAPNAPVLYDENGELNWENSTWINPLAESRIRYNNDVINFTGNSIISYEIIPDLIFKTSFGISYLQSEERTKYPYTFQDPAEGWTSAQSAVSAAGGTNKSWIIEPQLNWKRKIAKGELTLLAGTTFQELQLDRRADRYEGFPNNALMGNLASASINFNFEFVQELYRYTAVFGRLNYNWNRKYILNLTARRDGSSRFGPDKQFANFGAIGAAWILSNEPFLRDNLLIISFAKLRASFGSTGSDQIGNYKYLDTYSTNSSTSSYFDQYQGVTWVSPTKLFNTNYAWEVNKKFEVAMDFGFMGDRLSLEVSYFNNRSSNQLVNYTLPTTTGFTGILANLPATVQNTGIEMEMSSFNFKSKHLNWTTQLNVTVPRNKLIRFPDIGSSTYANKYVVGHPLSVQKVFESKGVDPQTGLWTFTDVNGDGIISIPEDYTKLMFVGQEFYGGINNSLMYKNWSLDFFFQFVKQRGYEVMRSGTFFPGSNYNMPAFVLEKKIWREEGDEAEIQKLSTIYNTQAFEARSNYIKSDATIGDASFIRLKNVSLAYEFPNKWTKDLTCRIYFQGQNLLLITGYEGDDPENQNFSNLPPLRLFTIGVQLMF